VSAVSTSPFWFEGGRLSLDFIATAGLRSGERLGDPGRLAAWLEAAGLTDGPPPATAGDLDDAHALRAVLERIVRAALDGRGCAAADVDALNAVAARESAPRILVLRDGELAGQAPPPEISRCLGTIARDAIDLLTGPERHRLRACAGEGCSGVYVDRSRGGRRKWCTASGCGNRARVTAHRRRAAEAGA
jgi:predicted RNA-binding Zn ribbon-like protein